jgi:hypothetical protein
MNLLTTFNGVFSVAEHFRLNNRHKPILLADRCVASQDICVLHQCLMRWHVIADVKNAAPLGKMASALLVFGTAFSEFVQSFRYFLI